MPEMKKLTESKLIESKALSPNNDFIKNSSPGLLFSVCDRAFDVDLGNVDSKLTFSAVE